MDIKIENLKRHFPNAKAVDGITFSFSSGHIFGFVGPNGAGKSTTMRIIATLDEPTEGDVTIDGLSVTEYPEETRKLVGYMPDTLPAHRDMTVHEYLDFFARAYGLRGKRRDDMVSHVEDFTNLNKIRNKFLKDLSKGMKQRVSLARALVHDPPILVLDEPAAGLDPRARIELRELLKILAEQGKAILISSHILTELSEICNGAVIIEQGRLLKAGHIDQLTTSEEAMCRVLIRSIGSVEELYREVLQAPHVNEVRIVNRHVEAELPGGDEECEQFLQFLIRQNLRIVEFHQHQMDLEEVFMTVTRGQVQ
jgi:ABC-2 type transport system ATP-binding protein